MNEQQPVDPRLINLSPFGLRVEGLDCANADLQTLTHLGQLLAEHEVLVIPDQGHLTPADEVFFNRALAPCADTVWRDQRHNPWEVFKVQQGNTAGTWQIPDNPGVLVIGKGRYVANGLDVELGGNRRAYGHQQGSQVLGGGALQWHIDGEFYRHEPCRVGQMRCLEAPTSRLQRIEYWDGNSFECMTGATVFVSGRKALSALTPDQTELCFNLTAHYAAHPFRRVMHLGNSDSGLRVLQDESQKDLDDSNESQVDKHSKSYPVVWKCPQTDQGALMIHPRCLLNLEDNRDGKRESTQGSRMLAEELMQPGIRSDQIYIHNWQPGDLVIWNNFSVWHSATGGLNATDRRVMHLTAFNGLHSPERADRALL